MDKSEETIPKDNRINDKNEQFASLDTNIQKSPAKKKFCNTVFAAKMRNRKKEEKLKEIDSAKVLTNCKGMSIDVTRINSEAVPKLITAVVRKHRKRKRGSRWKLGVIDKRKKSHVKRAKVKKVNEEHVSDKRVGMTNEVEMDSLSKEEKKEENNLELVNIYSCRRTEPFIGKLKTKEARILNINKICNNQVLTVSQNNNKPVKNDNKGLLDEKMVIESVSHENSSGTENKDHEKNVSECEIYTKHTNEPIQSENNDLLDKTEKITTGLISHANSSVTENKNHAEIESKNRLGANSSTKRRKEKNENKNVDITDTEKELISQESKKPSNKVNETKENIDEEISCQRTKPFEGKTTKNTSSGVPAKSTDIICPDNVNAKLDSTNSNVSREPSSASIDSNIKENSSNVIYEKSKASSSDAKLKSNSDLTNSDANLKSSKDTNKINTKSKSESSQIRNDVEVKDSINDINNVPDSLNKTNIKEHIAENVALSNKIQKSSFDHNSRIELDSSPDDIEAQSTESDSENKNWSCSRTEPFKFYAHCSRTLPYVHSKNRTKAATSGDSIIDEISQPESVTEKHILREVDKSNNEINIPRNSENESIDHAISSTTINSRDNAETFIQNGEWKFRRKRQKINSEDENKIEEETHPSKKSKTKSSPAKIPINQKLTATPVSPGRTICSFLSVNCTKHDHHTHYDEQQTSLIHKPGACVLLTRLEHINDPIVIDYLKKTDSTSRTNSGLLSAFENNSEKSSINTDYANLAISNKNKMDEVTKDSSVSFSKSVISDTNGNSSANTIKPTEPISRNKEKLLRPKSRLRRRSSSEMSTESPSITRAKRNKHPVNYLEDFSDSDEDKPSFSMSLRTRAQSRGPSLFERNNQIMDEEMNENDTKVEELSHVGRKSSPQSRVTHESNLNISNQDKFNNSAGALSRSLSRATRVAVGTFDSEHNKSFTDDQSELNAKLSSIHNELNKQCQVQEDAELDKEIEEHTRNFNRLKSRSRSPDTNSLNSSSCGNLNQLAEEFQVDSARSPSVVQSSDEKQFVTPKSSIKSNVLVSGQMSRASRSISCTPRNISITPSRSGRESSCSSVRSSTPRPTKVLTKNLSTKITRSRSNSENAQSTVKPATKTVLTQDLKVQLIKLETVCQSFKDYSSTEIEVLTRKYIDLLMNSNFTCDTWRTPINYHRPTNTNIQQFEQIDNTDCVLSDVEIQRDDIDDSASVQEIERIPTNNSNEEHTILEERIIIEIPIETSAKKKKEASHNKTKEAFQQKSDQQNISQTPLESVIATLLDRVEPLEKRDFSVLRTIVPEKEKNNDQIQFSVDEASRVNQAQIDLTDKDTYSHLNTSAKQINNTLLVNGTTMYTCHLCNKIFVIEDLLKEHILLTHNEDSGNTVFTFTTSPNEKQTTETVSGSSSSKISPEKVKKRYKYSDSLKCAICLQVFKTKELLFTHIMKHNEVELQEAYKTAIAMRNQNQDTSQVDASESNVDSDPNHKKKIQQNRKKSTSSSITSCRSSIDGEVSNANDSRATLTRIEVDAPIQQQQQIIDLAGNDANAEIETVRENVYQKPISICPCHAHETTNQDLQIEMVLLCKTCNVIFRRRDCFEVHYRSSAECRLKRTNNEITKVPKLFCSGCPCVLESLMMMREHLEEHAKRNNQGTVTFICNICKVAFFGVGGIFYSHWFNHTKAPNFVASRYSFPKLSVVTVLEDPNSAITTSKTQEGFFYIAEHVCRQCRLPFSSEPELQRHKERPCQLPTSNTARSDGSDSNRLQMIKLICDLCKKYYVNKENFDRHCSERNHLKTPPPKFSRLPINSNEQAFVCGLCRAVMKSGEEMKEHWKRIHSPIMELYTCKTCNVVPSNDVTNYTYEKFEKHCRIFHKSEVITCLVYFVTARYVCSICKFGFESERSMKEHQVVHQKRSTAANITSTSQPVPPVSTVMPINPALPSFWVSDQPGADGGMQMHPIYLQYSNLNTNTHPQVSVSPNTVNIMNLANNQQMQIQNTLIHAGTLNVTPTIITSDNLTEGASIVPTTIPSDTNENVMLRTILAQPGINQSQSSAVNSVPCNSTIETIQIDSRSNSPILDTAAPTVTGTVSNSNTNSIMTDKTVSSSALRKKSYMTMLNPDFESMLGTNKNLQINEISIPTSTPDKHSQSSSTNSILASTESETPQPFEVVLVTDDLSENSNGESGTTKDQPVNQQQQLSDSTESLSAKPFLRVRSIAELQKIKIHLCSVCGLSFDTPAAFEQHLRVHETPNEVGRATPVQMISPMVSQTNKETPNQAHEKVLQQMRQKLSSLTANGSPSPNNSDSSQTIEQQQQNYWHPPSNGIGINTNSNVNNIHNANQQQRRSQQQNIPRQSVNSPVTTMDPYLLVPSRTLPPPYPGTTNTVTPSRPGTIQLPERNLTDSSTPGSKRPSGAATRIPQQSLPSFEELTGNRQANARVSYNCNPTDNSAQNHPILGNRLQINTSPTPQMMHHMPVHKTYSRNPNELNYSGSISNSPSSYQSSVQQRKNIYSCKVYGCNYRSNNLPMFQSHEFTHHKQTSGSSTNQEIQMHSPQQSQRHASKHVSVIQMPERPRHAVPSQRLTPTNNAEKRLVCRICNFTCTTSTELIQHVSNNHSAPAPNQVCCYVCDYCTSPLIFDSEDLLRKHMNTSHNHSCNLCNKRYPSKEDLMMHMDVHTRNT